MVRKSRLNSSIRTKAKRGGTRKKLYRGGRLKEWQQNVMKMIDTFGKVKFLMEDLTEEEDKKEKRRIIEEIIKHVGKDNAHDSLLNTLFGIEVESGFQP